MVLISPATFLITSVAFFAAMSTSSATTVRWASSGGGWRSMVANMGWAHAFSRAGMIDSSSMSSQFSAVSSNSGGAWFSMQFFYSDPFFQRVVASPDSVFDLVQDWMGSYANFLEESPNSFVCSVITGFGIIPALSDVRLACNILSQVNFGYANFVDGMVRQASADYLDRTLMDRTMDSDNRVMTMANTDLFIQMSLSPTAISATNRNELIRVGPNNSDNVYAVFIPLQYSVKTGTSFYNYAVDDADLPFQIRKVQAPSKTIFRQWEPYHLFPGEGGNVFADISSESGDMSPLADFFGGQIPAVGQIMGATSATFGRFSGLIPSFLVQWLSITRSGLLTGSLLAQFFTLPLLNVGLNLIYRLPFTQDFSVCAQWPSDCGSTDGRFADGGNSDGPTLALNIGHHHTIDGANLTESLKVIVTNNNFRDDSNVKFLSYFKTTFNQGVAPGDFVWPPGTVPGDLGQENPWRSMQIFDDYLDDESMLAAFEPVNGTDLTTAVYEATTTSNPAFGVKAGQRVQILLLQINSDIPTAIFLRNQIETNTLPLANMAKTIAESNELVTRIQAFLAL